TPPERETAKRKEFRKPLLTDPLPPVTADCERVVVGEAVPEDLPSTEQVQPAVGRDLNAEIRQPDQGHACAADDQSGLAHDHVDHADAWRTQNARPRRGCLDGRTARIADERQVVVLAG